MRATKKVEFQGLRIKRNAENTLFSRPHLFIPFSVLRRFTVVTSDIEKEVHYIPVLDDIILAFDAELACSTACSLGLEFHKVIIFDYFGADEAFLEV